MCIVLGLLAFVAASDLGQSQAGASGLASHAIGLMCVGLFAAGCYGVMAGVMYWDNVLSSGIGVLRYVLLCFCAFAAIICRLLLVVESMGSFFRGLF